MRSARLLTVWLAVAGAVAPACAARRAPATDPASGKPTLVVLLTDPEGTVGRARVSNEFGGVDLTEENHATLVRADGRPSPVRTMDPLEVRRVFAAALAALPPVPRRFTLRFKFESDELTDESRAMLPLVIDAVKTFPVPEVVVVGHTDTMGDAKANVALGLKRATSVQRMLVRSGLDASIIEVGSHGEADPEIKTADNSAEPRNRRVEIVVR